MKIRILTIGQKMPAWVLTGFEDYFKRIQPFVQTQIIELPMAKRGKNDSEADILKYRQIEGDSILSAVKQNEVLIALEVGGREFSTEKLAETMKGWMLEGNDVVLAIGGPDGHSEAVRKAAAWHWSLSKLTLRPMQNLFCRDIDNDSIIEIPTASTLPGYEDMLDEDALYLTTYNILTPNVQLTPEHSGVINTQHRYMLAVLGSILMQLP